MLASRSLWLVSNAMTFVVAFTLSLSFCLFAAGKRPLQASPGPGGGAVAARDDGDDEERKPAKKPEKKPAEKAKKGSGSGGSEESTKKPAEPAKGKSEKADGDDDANDESPVVKPEKPPKKPLTIEEQYVRENLEKYIHPTKIEYLTDGRVKLEFDFGEKNEDQESIFTPRVSKDINSRFRWSLRTEWPWTWGWGGTTRNKDGEYEYAWEGLRIANDGAAHLNIWFMDDVEAEISYVQAVSSSPKQTVAVVFTNTSGGSLGSNFGSQCVTFSGGSRKTAGAIETIPNDRSFKLKLLVRDGKFEAYRDGKQKQTMDYNKKSYASGKIGFLWGGGVASFIHRLEVTGKVDSKKMAEQLRKGSKK